MRNDFSLNRRALLRLGAGAALAACAPGTLHAGPLGSCCRGGGKKQRPIRGQYCGVAVPLAVPRERVAGLIPTGLTLVETKVSEQRRLEVHPVVVLLGAQHHVEVQLGPWWVQPEFLRHYNIAYIVVPGVQRIGGGTKCQQYSTYTHAYTCSTEVIERGDELDDSPKYLAAIENRCDLYRVRRCGQTLVDVKFAPPAAGSELLQKSDAAVADIGSYFQQLRIDLTPEPNRYAFDMLGTRGTVKPVKVNGVLFPEFFGGLGDDMLTIPAAGEEPGIAGAFRFAARWEKQPR